MRKCSSIFILISIVLMVGCNPPKPKIEIGWPPPPAEPRITYQKSIYGSQSLDRSFWGGIKDFLFGKAKPVGLIKPYGISVDSHGRLFVADTGRKGIMIIDQASGTVDVFRSLGRYGNLKEPVYIIHDNQENLYVADTELKKIAVFDSQQKFMYFIGDDGMFEGPVGMTFDKEFKRLFVVDAKAHQIKIFSLTGEFLTSFGSRGDDQGQFYFPMTIKISSGDTIYVVDAFHFAVQAFDIDGKYLFSFGPDGAGASIFQRPRDIGIDFDDNIYITDALGNQLLVFDTKGRLLLRLGSQGAGPGRFNLPAGIDVDDKGFIYISDSMNGRVQKFKYLTQDEIVR